MCPSSGFDSIGSNDIGLRFLGCDVSCDFGSGITLASFSCDGKQFFSMQRLYAYVRGSIICGSAILSSLTGISSGPTALVSFSLVMRLPTSGTVL